MQLSFCITALFQFRNRLCNGIYNKSLSARFAVFAERVLMLVWNKRDAFQMKMFIDV